MNVSNIEAAISVIAADPAQTEAWGAQHSADAANHHPPTNDASLRCERGDRTDRPPR